MTPKFYKNKEHIEKKKDVLSDLQQIFSCLWKKQERFDVRFTTNFPIFVEKQRTEKEEYNIETIKREWNMDKKTYNFKNS